MARIHDSSHQLLLRKPSHDAASSALTVDQSYRTKYPSNFRMSRKSRMANTRVMLSHFRFSVVAGRRTSVSALALLASAFTLCLAGSAGSVAGAQTAETATIVLSHVRLIDGTGRAPILDATLVIKGNSIAEIRRGKFIAPANARVLDLHG